MSDFLYAWGPTIAILLVVLFVVRVSISKQVKVLEARNVNSALQTVELRNISEHLGRIAGALEGRNVGSPKG
jgi:hypothetical protein